MKVKLRKDAYVFLGALYGYYHIDLYYTSCSADEVRVTQKLAGLMNFFNNPSRYTYRVTHSVLKEGRPRVNDRMVSYSVGIKSPTYAATARLSLIEIIRSVRTFKNLLMRENLIVTQALARKKKRKAPSSKLSQIDDNAR